MPSQCRTVVVILAVAAPVSARLLFAVAVDDPFAGTPETVTTTVSSRLPLASLKATEIV